MTRTMTFSLAMMILAGLLLAACASLSEGECKTGDWRGIGFSDGAEGRSEGYISRHQKACADFGIVPDLQAWLAGRAEGLKAYCTPAKAYRVGRDGDSLSPVCTPAQVSSMEQAYFFGRQYYDIDQEQTRLRSDRTEVNDRLSKFPIYVEGKEEREKRRLRDEVDRLDRRIRQLDADKRRYSDWPPI